MKKYLTFIVGFLGIKYQQMSTDHAWYDCYGILHTI